MRLKRKRLCAVDEWQLPGPRLADSETLPLDSGYAVYFQLSLIVFNPPSSLRSLHLLPTPSSAMISGVSRPTTPGLSPRSGSSANLHSTLLEAAEKDRQRAEAEVQQALLKAEDGLERAKKEINSVSASSPGESCCFLIDI